VYWTVYNSLLMGAQDALVAHYPSLELSDERNVYERDVRSPLSPSALRVSLVLTFLLRQNLLMWI
jgi:hypothetical protein